MYKILQNIRKYTFFVRKTFTSTLLKKGQFHGYGRTFARKFQCLIASHLQGCHFFFGIWSHIMVKLPKKFHLNKKIDQNCFLLKSYAYQLAPLRKDTKTDMVFISNFDSMLLQAFQVKIILIYFNCISDVLRTRYHTWIWKIWFLRLRASANTKCFTVTEGRYGRTSEMPFFMCIKPWHANDFD